LPWFERGRSEVRSVLLALVQASHPLPPPSKIKKEPIIKSYYYYGNSLILPYLFHPGLAHSIKKLHDRV